MRHTLWLAVLAGGALGVAQPAQADMKIGTAGPLANAEALFGTTWQNGMQLAIDEVNAAGGINGEKIELVREDDQGDPKQGTLVAQKFCDDDEILAVVANFNSGVTIPSSDVYHRCGMPQVTNSSNPKVTEAGYANLFRPIANDFMQGGAPATYALETLGAKKAAVVHDKQAFGEGVATVFRTTFEKGGGSITSYSGVAATDMDFSAVITQLKAENPDVVYYGGTMPGVGLFLKQLRELGVKSGFFAGDPAFLPDLITTAGTANAAGAMVVRGTVAQADAAQWVFHAIDNPAPPPEGAAYRMPGGGDDTIRLFALPGTTTLEQLHRTATQVRSAIQIRHLFVYSPARLIAIRASNPQLTRAAAMLPQP